MGNIIEYHIELDDKALVNMVTGLIDDKTMQEIHNLYAKMIDPWVPYLEGPLSQTLNITPEFVEYLVPYAHYQYVGDNFNHTTDYHPLATARWDKVAMQTELESFKKQVTAILERRAKEIYG